MAEYKAGTAWLEIIPSFKGIEGAMAAEVEKLGRQVDATLAKSIPEGIRHSAQNAAKEMAKAGDTAGSDFATTFGKSAAKDMDKVAEEGAKNFAGRFKNALRARTGPAQSAIPKIEIDADTSPIEAKLAQVRKNISTLDQAFTKGRIGEATLLSGISGQQKALQDVQNQAKTFEDFTNARAAKAELDQWTSMLNNMRLAGLGSNGAFGGAFDTQARQSLQGVLKDLPQVNTSKATTDAEKELATVRKNLEDLQKTRIGIDLDLGPYLMKLAEAEAQLKALGDKHIELKYDTDKALAKIGKLFDDVLPKKADEGGDQMGGQFAEKFGQRVGKAIEALPDVKVNADTTDSQLKLAAIRGQLSDLSKETIGVSLDEGLALAEIEDLKIRLDELAKKDPSVRVRVEAAAAATELEAILVLAGRVDKSDPTIKVKTDNSTANNSLKESESLIEKLADAAGIGGSRLAAIISISIALGSILVPAAGAAAVAIGGIAQAATAAGAGIGVFALGISGVGGAVQALNQYENQQAKSAASLTKSEDQVAGAVDAVNSAERSLANTRENVADAAKAAAQTVIDAQRGVSDAMRGVADAHKNVEQAVKDLAQAYEDARKADEDRVLSIRQNELAQRQAALDLADAKQKLDAIIANPRATQAEREQAQITYQERILQIDQLSVQGKRLKEEQDQADKAGIEGSKQVVAAKDKVASAQENLQKANESVQSAEERLAKAITDQQKQQREGAYQIAQATQSVINAQRQLERATVSAGVSGGAALLNLNNALQQLGPAGAEFAKYLYSLKPAFIDLRESVQSAMLPGLQNAIQGLTEYLPQIKRFATDVGAALGGIFQDMVRQLGDPTWQRFFGWVAATAVPTLQGMYKFFSLIAKGVADLILALSPLNEKMGHGLLGMAQTFADWAATLSQTSGYRKFIDYVTTNGPKVLTFLGQLTEFLIHVVQAAAPIGSTTLGTLTGIFRWLNSLPLSMMTTFVTILTNFYSVLLSITGVAKIFSVLGTTFEGFGKVQTKLWGGLKDVIATYRTELGRVSGSASEAASKAGIGTGLLNGTLLATQKSLGGISSASQDMAFRLSGAAIAAENAGRGMGIFSGFLDSGAKGLLAVSRSTGGVADNMRSTTGEITKTSIGMNILNGVMATGATAGNTLKKGFGALVGLLGGPVGFTLTAATIAFGLYYEQQQKIKQQTDEMNGALESIANAYKQGGDAAVTSLARTNAAVRDTMNMLRQYGITSQQVFQAQSGNQDAQHSIISTLQAQSKQLDQAVSDFKDHKASWGQVFADVFAGQKGEGQNLLERKQAIDALIPKLKQQYAEEKALAEAEAEAERNGTLFKQQLQDVTGVLRSAAPTADEFKTAISTLGDMSIDSSAKVASLSVIADKVADSNLSASEKAGLFRSVLDQIGQSVDTHGQTFDALTSVFNDIADSALSASDKTSLLNQALNDLYGAKISQSEADEKIARSQVDLSQALQTSSAGFDLKTAKTEADKDAILRNRDALEAALQSTRDKYVADIVAGQTEEQARDTHDKLTKSILDQIDPTQRNSQAVQDLVNTYGAIPPEKKTQIKTDGLDSAIEQLIVAHAVQFGLSQTPPWTKDQIQADVQWLTLVVNGEAGTVKAFKADGGFIDGYSPHDRADNIHAMLTAGEWVQPVASVNYYGTGIMEAMRQRMIPRELLTAMMPRFADGGLADGTGLGTWPITINPPPVPDVNALWSKWQSTVDAYNSNPAGSDVSRWTSVVLSVLAQLGQPGNLLGAVLRRMQFESGGNPTIVNTTDSNWYAGTPSVGLMQVIGPTFARWAGPYRNVGPFEYGVSTDGRANTYAGLNYAIHRYGSIAAIDPLVMHSGYAGGGLVLARAPKLFDDGGFLQPGMNTVYNGTGQPEPVLNPQQWQDIASTVGTGQTGGNVYQFAFRDTTLTESKLRAMQAADALRARAGRRR